MCVCVCVCVYLWIDISMGVWVYGCMNGFMNGCGVNVYGFDMRGCVRVRVLMVCVCQFTCVLLCRLPTLRCSRGGFGQHVVGSTF